MVRSKRCRNRASSEMKISRSFLSKLRSILSVFQCSGKNSVRVQPTHISVRPATATMDVRAGNQRPKTPLVFFSSSRPSTATKVRTCRTRMRKGSTAHAHAKGGQVYASSHAQTRLGYLVSHQSCFMMSYKLKTSRSDPEMHNFIKQCTHCKIASFWS